MANFVLKIPELGNKFIDYRQQVPGDSFNWSWIRSLDIISYLAIHHTAGPDNQSVEEIANYHINNNGWGGIGYHFVISQTGVVYYVGDIYTARANVKDLNDKVIGICLVGNFVNGREPTVDQINSTHLLCAKLLFNTPELPNVNGWEDMVGHKNLNQTVCPGDGWVVWRGKIISAGVQVDGNKERITAITRLFVTILGRQPDQEGLSYWVNSNLSIDSIRQQIVESTEHQQLIYKARNCKDTGDTLSEIKDIITRLHERLKTLGNSSSPS